MTVIEIDEERKMLRSTKVLIHEERQDAPEFLLNVIVNRGYKACLAKDGAEIVDVLSKDQYDIVVTNGGYRELNTDHHTQLKSSSVFIIDITDSHKQTHNPKADLCLLRPFLISELWRAIETPF